jgi:cytoskeletal protein RodZ
MKLKKPSTKLQSPKKPVKHAVKKAQAIPKLLWPLTPWTICFIGVVILFCGSVGALFIQYDHSSTTPTKSTGAVSTSGSNNSSNSIPTTSAPTSKPQSTTPTPVQQKSSNTNSSSSNSQPNAGDCGSPSTAGYQECVNSVNYINLTTQCDNEISAADAALKAVYDPAQATYNTDIATRDQQAESDYPAGSYTLSEVEYNIINAETTKYNATVAPAWATYQAAFGTFNSQGCTQAMTYSESNIIMSTM